MYIVFIFLRGPPVERRHVSRRRSIARGRKIGASSDDRPPWSRPDPSPALAAHGCSPTADVLLCSVTASAVWQSHGGGSSAAVRHDQRGAVRVRAAVAVVHHRAARACATAGSRRRCTVHGAADCRGVYKPRVASPRRARRRGGPESPGVHICLCLCVCLRLCVCLSVRLSVCLSVSQSVSQSVITQSLAHSLRSFICVSAPLCSC